MWNPSTLKGHSLMQILCLLQILTHVKEKLQFAQKEKEGMQVELDSVEAALATHRDDLSRVKLVRDKAIVGTRKLRDAGSQVTNTALLADLEVWDHDMLFSIPKSLFLFRNVIPTLEIYPRKRLGTVKMCFYIEKMSDHCHFHYHDVV